jgi:RNA polymerase sigma-70 factor (ECF subfamily)
MRTERLAEQTTTMPRKLAVIGSPQLHAPLHNPARTEAPRLLRGFFPMRNERTAPIQPDDLHAALGELRPVLLRIARVQLRNDTWAEDAVSETLLAALENAHKFAGRSQLKTWVVGILRHKMIDQLRRFNREVSTDAAAESAEDEVVERLYAETGSRVEAPLDWGDPEESLARMEFFDILEVCVEKLPPTLARVFMMREWLEFETPEICKELGINRGHLFVLLYRARMRLRECLEHKWFATPTGIGHA